MRIDFRKISKQLNTVAISSKSYVHRLLIASALSGEASYVYSNIVSKDMEATVNCLNNLGADIVIEDGGFRINRGVSKMSASSIDCNESGSTARFLLPLGAYLCDELTMVGHGKLPQRPFGPLTQALNEHGVDASSEYLPITTKGTLTAGDFSLPGNISSQYITGLLFVLPLLEKDSRILLTTNLESKGYIDITLDVLKSFGIKIDFQDNIFTIPGGQKYQSVKEVYAEGDWSNSAYLLGMGALSGQVEISGLNPNSLQGDRAVLDILQKFGALVSVTKDTVKVEKNVLHGIDTDVSQIPDLVPGIAVIASFADSDTRLRHVERLRIKESDRIESVKALLEAFGKKAVCKKYSDGEDLIICAADSNSTSYAVADSFNDHRIVMAAFLGAWGMCCELELTGENAINKSYPGFFDLFVSKE